MELGRPPLFERLAGATRVLIAGAGGGFDVYCGLPLYRALQKQGKSVHLASLAFSGRPESASGPAPTAYEVRPDTVGGSDSYFPEKWLAEWFRTRGEEVAIHCFELSGVRPLREAYAAVVQALDIDAVVLVDGGTDSLMRGDESGLGTPAEDVASIAAVDVLDVPHKALVCLGFGVDDFHGVSHHDFLEAVAELTRRDAFLGTMSVLPGMPEARDYTAAVEFAHGKGSRGSIVNSSIASAVEGAFGDHHRLERTRGSQLWINPLMAQYFCFDLHEVARRVLYLPHIRETQTLFEIHAIIQGFRKQIGIRPRRPIPL